jgi:hypothetical protein
MSAIRGATRLRRGGKSRKGRKNKGAGLSQDDIDYLTKNTKYDETEIKEWYKGFKVCIVEVVFFSCCCCVFTSQVKDGKRTHLSDEDIEYLTKNTKYDKTIIKKCCSFCLCC